MRTTTLRCLKHITRPFILLWKKQTKKTYWIQIKPVDLSIIYGHRHGVSFYELDTCANASDPSLMCSMEVTLFAFEIHIQFFLIHNHYFFSTSIHFSFLLSIYSTTGVVHDFEISPLSGSIERKKRTPRDQFSKLKLAGTRITPADKNSHIHNSYITTIYGSNKCM